MFAEIKQSKQNTFKKTQFMSVNPPGQYVIRILNTEALPQYRHWINGAQVLCLGDGCPQCELNQSILVEKPKDATKIKGYSSRSQRFVVNVLDQTPVKICPKCSAENQKTSSNCYACESFIADVKADPSNTVKVLDKGIRLFEQLNGVQVFLNGLDDDVKAITDVSIVVNVTGTKRQPAYAAIPINKKLDPIPQELELYDLEKIGIRLERKEMLDLMSGVQLKDILVARSSESGVSEETPKEKEQQGAVNVSEIIAQLYNQ